MTDIPGEEDGLPYKTAQKNRTKATAAMATSSPSMARSSRSIPRKIHGSPPLLSLS
jgi:hypothetical protein